MDTNHSQLAALAARLPEREARPKLGRFVVLGSYLKEANARLAADGVSYVTSGESVTDHAISVVANEDCAMWRALRAR
ncbi:MAG: hypothetical protein O7D31_07995, partial [Alphaproteobacteria bacterium]|nr:hypothetical protein [Alphaproteobacteria bacterium]